jgi:hypothetical protein
MEAEQTDEDTGAHLNHEAIQRPPPSAFPPRPPPSPRRYTCNFAGIEPVAIDLDPVDLLRQNT